VNVIRQHLANFRMIIIDKNKDYYDYLAGIEGRDTDLVFDRRGSAIISKEIGPYLPVLGVEYHPPLPDPIKEKYIRIEYFLRIGNWNGLLYNNVVLDSNNKVKSIGEDHFSELYKSADGWPMRAYYSKCRPRFDYEELHFDELCGHRIKPNENCITAGLYIYGINEWVLKRGWETQFGNNKKICTNPILSGTRFASMCSPLDTWNYICEWLLSQREKPIVDNRTDIEKLEAAGFDKVTSFRKM